MSNIDSNKHNDDDGAEEVINNIEVEDTIEDEHIEDDYVDDDYVDDDYVDDGYVDDGTAEILATDDEEGSIAFATNMSTQSVHRENTRLYKDIKSKSSNLKLSLGVNAGLIFLLILFIIAFINLPKTKYIATKDNASICEVYPSDNPNLTDATIREFGKDAVLNLYTFDYINYETQINNVLERNFTPIGRDATNQAMERAGIIQYVTENALTFKSSAMNAARIEEKSVNADGKDYWIVRFPMVLDIYSGKLTPIDTQRHMVTVRIVADTASVSNPNGLGVSSVTLAPL